MMASLPTAPATSPTKAADPPPSSDEMLTAEFLRSVLASSDDCIKVLDLDANLTFMSEGGMRVMEVSDFNAIRGCPWPSFWVGEKHADAMAAVAAAKSGGSGHFQGPANTLLGTSKWWDVRVTPIFGTDGSVEKLLSISRDITPSKLSEVRRSAIAELGDCLRDIRSPDEMAFAGARVMGETLSLSRAGYGTVDASGAGVSIERDWSTDGAKSLAGEHSFRDYGSFVEDLRRGNTVIISDVRDDARTASFKERLEALGIRSIINLPVMEHGRFVALFYLHDAQARSWTPEEIGFVSSVADRVRSAVERARAENNLRKLKDDLERQVAERTRERDRVWQNSQDLILVIDRQGKFLAVNPAVTRILGWAPDDLIGQSVFNYLHPEDQNPTGGALEQAKQELLPSFKNRYRHADGSYRMISWVAAPAEALIYAYGRDVTAEEEQAAILKQTEEQLRQAQKMEAVGQLTGGLAHDFNNLLTGITGSLQLLERRIAAGRSEEIGQYVAAARDAAQRASALTHRLLAFSRRQTLDPKATDVAHLIDGMKDLIQRTIGPEIALETVGAANLWPVRADPGQLENAILNLSINARDAMPDGGELVIETAHKLVEERTAKERGLQAGQFVSISVSDNGSGMAPDVMEKVFEPFFTTKPIGRGTGLGLSMIYGFAQQSGGYVEVWSELGVGSKVSILLPRHVGEIENHRETLPEPVNTPRSEGGQTVLVVDDEPTIRMLVTDILEDLGYAAIEAVDGASALKVVKSNVRIDLLVTDVGLPGGMNGRQMADAARTSRPDLKVLFITGYAEKAVLGQGDLEPGMHVLTKPFALETLATRIGAFFE